MVYAAIAFASAALAMAGVALVFSRRAGAWQEDFFTQQAIATKAKLESEEFEDDLAKLSRLRAGDEQTIERQRRQIENLGKLLREHAPDGVAASQFDDLLQAAAAEGGNENSSD